MRNNFLMAVVALCAACTTHIAVAIEMNDLEVTIRVIESDRDVSGDKPDRSEIGHKLELPEFKDADEHDAKRQFGDRDLDEYRDRNERIQERDDGSENRELSDEDREEAKKAQDEAREDRDEARDEHSEARDDLDEARDDHDEAREDHDDATEDREDSRD